MDIKKLMKQAKDLKKLQKEISNTILESEVNGAKLSISGTGEVKSFIMSKELYNKGKEEIEKAIFKVITSCLRKQLDLQKEKAKQALKGINLPKIWNTKFPNRLINL